MRILLVRIFIADFLLRKVGIFERLQMIKNDLVLKGIENRYSVVLPNNNWKPEITDN